MGGDKDRDKAPTGAPPATCPIVYNHEHAHCTFISLFFPMSSTTSVEVDGLEERIRQRAAAKANPLDTVPVQADHQPRGFIPNTPLSVSLISFLLGSLFAFGLLLFATNGFGRYWWSTSQLGFFLAAWSAFHWGEFAVTAGWNREKCSVDCELAYQETYSFILTLALSISFGEWSAIPRRAFCRVVRIPHHSVLQT